MVCLQYKDNTIFMAYVSGYALHIKIAFIDSIFYIAKIFDFIFIKIITVHIVGKPAWPTFR